MSFGNPVLGRDVGEQGTGPLLLAAHPLCAVKPFSRRCLDFFSRLLRLSQAKTSVYTSFYTIRQRMTEFIKG